MSQIIPNRIITGEQIRGARAMLRLDQKQFAALTHVSVGAIRRFERNPGPIVAADGVIEAVCQALETAGIEFIDAGTYQGIGGPGVRLNGVPLVPGDVIDMESAAEEAAADEIEDEKRAAPGA